MTSKSTSSEFEKLLSSPVDEKWKDVVEFRKANKKWLSISSNIALRVMDEMDKQGIKGNELGTRMNVSPQQVSKILKGRENLKLETISKLETALNTKIITILGENEVVVKNDYKRVSEEKLALLKQEIIIEVKRAIQENAEVYNSRFARRKVFSYGQKFIRVPAKIAKKSAGKDYVEAA
ncbi:MAG: helix-turn-helix transcriptional regulator [Cyclobacteriaceae bacterium]|nr:helix-turn-helix transcriptional regulator [Cyclobacteriaceae bacterium SS2]